MILAIADYGMGNIGSLRAAVVRCGGSPRVVTSPEQLESVSHVLLPGVGAFPEAMRVIHDQGWASRIKDHAEKGLPILGICLGMQLLAGYGEEGGGATGLNLIPGTVTRLPAPGLRIPHVGWNSVHIDREDPLLRGVDSGADFYFVHSFRFEPEEQEAAVATTSYGSDFVSVVRRGHVAGVQFHPEKSSKSGVRLIQNFLEI